jgi:hypothetical protein
MKRLVLSLMVGLLLVGAAPLSVFAQTAVFLNADPHYANSWGSGFVDGLAAGIQYEEAQRNQFILVFTQGVGVVHVAVDGSALVCAAIDASGEGGCTVDFNGTRGAAVSVTISIAGVDHTPYPPASHTWWWSLRGENDRVLLGITSPAGGGMSSGAGSWADPSAANLIPAAFSFASLLSATMDIAGSSLVWGSVVAIGGLILAVMMSDAALQWIAALAGFKLKPRLSSTEVEARLVKAKLEAKSLSVDDLNESNAVRSHEKQARDNMVGPVHYRGNYGNKDK